MPGMKLIGRSTGSCTTTIAVAVRNRLRSAAGRSHFQAKPIRWSIRTRGKVPRIQTKTNTKVNDLTMNQISPANQSQPM